MPSGSFDILDPSGRTVGTESFRAAPGPMGWRFVSTIERLTPHPSTTQVDLVVDASWQVVRLRLEAGDRSVLLARRGEELVGVHGDAELRLPTGAHLDGPATAFNAVTANRLGATAAIEAIYLDPARDGPVEERQRYELAGPEEVSAAGVRFAATRWGYAVEDIGGTADLWVAGAIVVAFPGMFRLTTYEPGASGPFPL